MVKAVAYLALSFLILGAMVFHWVGERARALATIDRRLDGIGGTGSSAMPLVRSMAAVSVPERIAPLLARAQVEVTAPALRIIVAAVLVAAVVLLIIAGPVATLALLIGLPVAVHSWLIARGRKRIDALVEALPYYLDSVRQLQAVGNSMSQAVERSLADAPEALTSYFAPVARRLAMGAPVAETMQQLADRLQVPEISMLAAAIRTNLRYGGSIAGVFNNLAHILRERIRIRRELAAATSEAKVSSRVLIAMPLICMAILMFLNPGYIDFFLSDERGHTLSVIAVAMEVLGIVVIRRMLRLEF